MAVRFTNTFISSSNITWKVDIYDSAFSGTATEFYSTGEGFTLDWEGKAEDRFNPIIASKLNVGFYVQDATGNTFIEDMIGSYDEDRFSAVVYKSGTMYWAGHLLQDLVTREDVYYPYVQDLVFTDYLGALKEIPFNNDGSLFVTTQTNTTGFYRPTEILCKILSSLTNLGQFWGASDTFLMTSMEWYEDAMPTPAASVDPLEYCKLWTKGFFKSNDQTAPWSAYTILEAICKTFGARLYQCDGQWNFIQIGNFKDSSRTERYYEKDATHAGTYSAAVTKDLTLDTTPSATANIKLAGSTNEYHPALRQTRVRFEHAASSYSLMPAAWEFATEYLLGYAEGGGSTQNTLQVELMLNYDYIAAEAAGLAANSHLWPSEWVFTGTLKVGTKYLTGSVADNTLAWDTSGTFTIESTYYGSEYGPTTSLVQLAFETPAFPEDGLIYLQISTPALFNVPNWGSSPPGSALTYSTYDDYISIVQTSSAIWGFQYYGFEPGDWSGGMVLLGDAPTERNLGAFFNSDGESYFERIFVTLNQTGGSTVSSSSVYDTTVLFGDSWEAGVFSPYSVRVVDASGNFVTPGDGWQAYGTGTEDELSQVLCDQILQGQKAPIAIFQGVIRSTTSLPSYRITDSSYARTYIMAGATLSAIPDEWDIEMFVIKRGSGGIGTVGKLNEGKRPARTNPGSGAIQGLKTLAGNQIITQVRTAMSAGTTTSVPINGVSNCRILADDVLTIFNPRTNTYHDMTVSEDAAKGATSVTVTSNTLSEALAIGCPIVFKSPQQAGQVADKTRGTIASLDVFSDANGIHLGSPQQVIDIQKANDTLILNASEVDFSKLPSSASGLNAGGAYMTKGSWAILVQPSPMNLASTTPDFWWEAYTGITLNSSDVASWMDRSGNGRDCAQTTAAEQPAYASAPTVTFDYSANQSLTFTEKQYAGEFTFIAVINPTSLSVSNTGAMIGSSTDNDNFIRLNSPTQVNVKCASVATTWNAGLTFTTGAEQLVVVQRDSSNVVTIWRNNSAGGTTRTITGTLVLSRFGAKNTNSSLPFNGQINEAFMFPSHLTTTELGYAYSYLNNKWDL